jgi:hypothetical protein
MEKHEHTSESLNKKTLLSSRLSKPDRPIEPVEPGTGPASGSVDVQNRSADEPGKNRKNRGRTGKTGKPPGPGDSPVCFFFLSF